MSFSSLDTNDIYNVSDYTDAELFELLDLNHPTDRELEAQILFFIKKYETTLQNQSNPNSITAKNAKTMIQFFENVYQRFFEIEEDDDDESQIEGFESISGNLADAVKSQTDICFNNISISKNAVITTPAPSISAVTEGPKTKDKPIGITRSLEYSKSYANPLLKETITRVISIDSQFRDQTIHTNSTDFIFNLSDTLQDVVSLKLYSIQIPYNWWTINKSFGSNYFFIKGASPGIIGNDYKFTISSGTYSQPSDVIGSIQASIAALKSANTDVSFGTTNLTIGTLTTSNPNSLATFVIDITNLYNETYFYLDWNTWSSPLDPVERLTTIPGLLGFNYQGVNEEYAPNAIYSGSFANTHLNDNAIFNLDASNNHFNIYLYDGNQNITYTNGQTPILHTIKVTLPLANGSYNRTYLLNAVNQALKNTPQLDPSSSIMTIIPDPTDTTNYSKYKLSIQLNRSKNPYTSISNVKLAVVFPDESLGNQIWVYSIIPDSPIDNVGCFYFNKTTNELNTIISESTSVITIYPITSNPYIQFDCIKPYYDNLYNQITITLPNANYVLSEYLAAINTQFSLTTYISNSYITTDSSSNIEFDFSISKRFSQSNYILDLSKCILHTDLGFNPIYTAEDLSNNASFYSNTFPPQPDGFQINSTNNTFYMIPDTVHPAGNINSPGYKIRIPIPSNNTYSTLNYLIIAINAALDNIDPTTLNPPLHDNNGNPITFEDKGGTFINNGFDISSNDLVDSVISATSSGDLFISNLSITVFNILRQSDYKVTFYDPGATPDVSGTWNTTNSWKHNLYLPDQSYNLIDYIDPISNYAVIKGTQAVRSNLITIDSTNNTFSFRARSISNGIYAGGSTDITFTIPTSTTPYTKEALISIMNAQFAANSLTTGTEIFIDGSNNTQIRMNINKVYTAKDYNLVFYDIYSFVFCNTGVTGASSKRNITKDATLGWILGFRSQTVYVLSTPNIDSVYSTNVPAQGSIFNGTAIATLSGDTTVNVNLYNYFMLILNDYTQNHLNDGLVTLITKDNSIPLPSYAERSTYVCDPVTGQLTLPSSVTNTNAAGNSLTQKQIYSANAILQNKQNTAAQNLFSNGPFIQDVFALIPIKISGYSIGQVFVEYGGTLQQQERAYFGPVNIHRMSVQLITDRGDVLDLNGANWSFGLVCQQLYHPPKS
jgi:hypothetical protein